ncbi:hypothetical protein AB0J52_18325 [Spirillospora sp. NPDC049652]
MTEFEDTYRHLLSLDTPLRREWLVSRWPAGVSTVHWWLALIERGVADVRRQRLGLPAPEPRGDVGLAASLIEWALDEGFPPAHAVGPLVQLATVSLGSGDRIEDLPAAVRPDGIARLALGSVPMSRREALDRAARLRAIPITEDDFVKPGEDITERLRAISQTDDYRDYHRLLDIARMLADLTPIIDLIKDAELVARLQDWTAALPDLDPVPPHVGGDAAG